jgi:PPOX class probable F420-dependent enzyme
MASLDDVRRFGGSSQGLVVVAVTRHDGTVSSTVVNAGVLPHPSDGTDVVGLVVRGGTVKHRVLRKRPRATVTFRHGWEWASVEGPVELIGPDDPHPAIDDKAVAGLLRDVFTAAGGSHDNWDEYDRVMADERRLAVLVRPERIYGVSR